MKPPVIQAPLKSYDGQLVRFEAQADDLLRGFEALGTIFDPAHVANTEIRTQIELLRFAIDHSVDSYLNDDHWSRTCQVFLRLFDEGKAWMVEGSGRIGRADLKKESWAEISGPLCGVGGERYFDSAGREFFRTQTWRA